MAVEVIMPKAGSEMEEGEIVQWFKQEGDEVKEGEILLEIVTDKVNMEVEAEASGTLLKNCTPSWISCTSSSNYCMDWTSWRSCTWSWSGTSSCSGTSRRNCC